MRLDVFLETAKRSRVYSPYIVFAKGFLQKRAENGWMIKNNGDL